jgi:hypothetical protein
MDNVTLYMDFDDLPAFQIFSSRYVNTSRILGITCTIEPAAFGEGKIHAKIVLSGNALDVERFMKFIDESAEFLEQEREAKNGE